jgi:hypothetical protein
MSLRDNTFTNLTIATLLFAQSQTLEFTGNEVRRCQAGLWFLSPAQAGYVVYDPLGLALMGLSVAMGYPLPSTSSQALAVPALPKSIRIYAAAPTAATVTDSNGNSWIPDSSAQATAAGVFISTPPMSFCTRPNARDFPSNIPFRIFLSVITA